MILHRTHLVAALGALAMILAAGPTLAATDLSDVMCEDPSDAAEDMFELLEDDPIDTSEFDEKICGALCKRLAKQCLKNVKLRGACYKSNDSFSAKLGAALCDGDSECKDFEKQEAAQCKADLKVVVEEGVEACAGEGGLFDQCVTECDNGAVFPDGGMEPPPI